MQLILLGVPFLRLTLSDFRARQLIMLATIIPAFFMSHGLLPRRRQQAPTFGQPQHSTKPESIRVILLSMAMISARGITLCMTLPIVRETASRFSF
ncbi:hypothetical protein XarjCFBP7653_00730 [Xanthomonas arboricola]|nr:hypothetical protein XarjCFBP7653_00730 [Xanthomonas arboricola]